MKYSLLLLCLTSIAFTSEGQQCVVANLKENIAYLGLPTPLGIAVEKCACKDLMVTTDNGTLKPTNDACFYDYMPAREGSAFIKVLNRRTNKELGLMPMRIKHLPTPTPEVVGYRDGAIPKKRLRLALGVVAVLPGMDLEIKIRVFGYWVAIFRDDQSTFFGRNNSAFFDDTIKTAFASLRTGDMVIIGGIRYQMPDRREGEMPAMTFTITE